MAKKEDPDAADSAPHSKPPKELKKIKSSMFSRSLTLAKMSLKASASLASHGVTQAFNNKAEKEESWKTLLSSQANSLTKELGQLKGSLMKAGQMLSMYGEHFLPPEANAFLKSLQSESPPLSWEAIEPHLKKYLSAELLAELEIEKKALASASMGQVHRARIKSSGESIVLKIQYPNVDKAINSDLKAIRGILSALKLLPKGLDLDPLFNEIRNMLVQETDYEMEANLTEKYFKYLENDSRFVVPKVFRRYSSSKVLATSFERGLRADDPVIQSLPQERRNRLAASFLDLYFKELFQWGTIQTDPHTGNYKIRVNPQGHDQLILLDFGATRDYDITFLANYRKMLVGALLNDKKMFYDAALALKFIYEEDDQKLKDLFEKFCFQSVEPFILPNDPRNTDGQIDAEGNYDWKNTTLPDRLTSLVFEIARTFSWRTPPHEITFLDRKTGGVFIFLSVLKSKFNSRNVMMKYVEPQS